MNALLLDASPSASHSSSRAADALHAALAARGTQVDRVIVRDLNLHPCTGCFGCWTKRPGECLIADDGPPLAARVIASDVLAVACPVSFGMWGSLAKSAFDRMIGLVLPHFTKIDGEVHHEPRYARYPHWIALGTQRRPNADAAALFAQLVARNAINFHSPSHAAEVVSEHEAAAAAADRLAVSVEVGS